jgi:hypothetical protein
MASLGDRVRMIGTPFTGRLTMVYTEHYNDDGKWTPAMIIFDNDTYGWFDFEDFVVHRGKCVKCKLYAMANEGGYLPGHPCAYTYGRCDEELEFNEIRERT